MMVDVVCVDCGHAAWDCSNGKPGTCNEPVPTRTADAGTSILRNALSVGISAARTHPDAPDEAIVSAVMEVLGEVEDPETDADDWLGRALDQLSAEGKHQYTADGDLTTPEWPK